MKIITKLSYNWFPCGDIESGMGEDMDVAEVGKIDHINKLEVKEIKEHPAAGEGDKWYYDIVYINGAEMRVFNPNTVLSHNDDLDKLSNTL